MKILQGKKGLIVIVTILLIISISLTIKPVDNPNIFQRGVQTVFLPIQKIVMWPVNSVKNSINFFREMKNYQSENEELTQENAKLKEENRQLQNAKIENDKLRKLLNLSEKYDINNNIVGEVITKDVGTLTDVLVINRGAKDGITIDSVVLTYDGLVKFMKIVQKY